MNRFLAVLLIVSLSGCLGTRELTQGETLVLVGVAAAVLFYFSYSRTNLNEPEEDDSDDEDPPPTGGAFSH